MLSVLNLFFVVRFLNEGCNASNSLAGTCYTQAECESRGGSPSGSCAQNYGVCCTCESMIELDDQIASPTLQNRVFLLIWRNYHFFLQLCCRRVEIQVAKTAHSFRTPDLPVHTTWRKLARFSSPKGTPIYASTSLTSWPLTFNLQRTEHVTWTDSPLVDRMATVCFRHFVASTPDRQVSIHFSEIWILSLRLFTSKGRFLKAPLISINSRHLVAMHPTIA